MDITGFPALDRAGWQAAALRARFAAATAQTAAGQRAESYAGLGADARRAVDLRAELARQETLARAAERGEVRAGATQAVLKRITQIGTDLSGKAVSLLGSATENVGMMAQAARAAMKEVAALLNERFEGEALFGGADLEGAPVPGDIEQSGMVRQIRAGVQGLASGGGAALRAALRDLGASDDPAVTPFSANATAGAQGLVDDPRRSVPVEEGVAVEIGLYANRNAAATPQAGPDSTGSWARDLLYGLAVISGLSQDQVALGEDYTQVVQGAIGALRAGLAGITEEAGALGTAEQRLAEAGRRHQEVAAQVEQQAAGVEEVDLAEAISRAQAMQMQLEASYRVLSMLGDLSLTKFLR